MCGGCNFGKESGCIGSIAIMISFTKKELETLAIGLDSIARHSKDVLIAAAELMPIRQKIEEEAIRLKEESEVSDGAIG